MLDNFENYLTTYDYGPQGQVVDAVKYSILNAGKRIRPMLLLSLLKDYGIDVKSGYSSALAIEMIHNYSLIHDDLPSMDDDDFRRGKLSTHKAYGEAFAVLAGDALLTMAFEVIADDDKLKIEKKVKLISLLSKHAGIKGMIFGQQLDLTYEGKNVTLKEIDQVNIFKTSNLLMFSLLAGAVIAEQDHDFDLLEEIGKKLGLAFQLQDDVFDATKSFAELGKKPSDKENDKSTYVKFLGLDKTISILNDLFEDCQHLINKLNLKSNYLLELIDKIKNRSN